MTAVTATAENLADNGSVVGIQASVVRDSTVYQVFRTDSPLRKYEVGVRFLEDGLPARARELINEAIARSHDNSEVRFHAVLALLSKRAYRDLDAAERESLARLPHLLAGYADDRWTRASRVVLRLVACADGSTGSAGTDHADALAALRALPPQQQDKIVRHLDLIMTGVLKDDLWAETRRRAYDGRGGGHRTDRVWSYFHPEPAEPLVRRITPNATTPRDTVQAVLATGAAAVAVGYLGWLVVRHGTVPLALAFLAALVATVVAARTGIEWRYRTRRLAMKDRDLIGQRGVGRAPEAGFAKRVHEAFAHYFARYVPKGLDRDSWLADTAGIRATLRDEVVVLYRERGVPVERIHWLIRYLVSEVSRGWAAGAQWTYRERYRTEPSTKLLCLVSVAVLIPTTVGVLYTVVPTAPVAAPVAAIAALVAGRIALGRWAFITGERQRVAEDERDRDQAIEDRAMAFQRWKGKLDARRPTENEMEQWLNHDRTALLDDALRHYHLAWRDIIAHGFLQTPATRYKRARVRGGPWRYSRYDLRLFLITRDGVREVSTVLDFERSAFQGQERNNFRFDAVSSVHVATTERNGYVMRLTLTNGPTRDIRVVDPPLPDAGSDEERSEEFPELNLDAAGFAHTLHILEGIAAEGRTWMHRDPHTGARQAV